MNPDAEYCFILNDAENAFTSRLPEPSLRPWAAANWTVRAYIIGNDAAFEKGCPLQLGDACVFWGWVLESKTLAGTFVIAIRGTMVAVDWYEDAKAAEREFPGGGLVELGFWQVYRSLVLRLPGGNEADLLPSLQRLIARGRGTFIGHSLGATVVTILAAEASTFLLEGRTSLRAIASPHPGNAAFAQLVATRVRDAKSIAYARDLVTMVPPSIPFLLNYCALPNRVALPPSDLICDNPLCNHHVALYGLMLGGREAFETAVAPDDPCRTCLRPGSA